MDFKLIGSILLIVGTTIGAGMLALPIATAQLGFTGSLMLLVVCWLIMTSAAFLLLEVNLWLPQNSNILSMAKATFGRSGQVVAWIVYLLLLYSLLCAYLAGSSDLFHNLLRTHGLILPAWAASLIVTLLLGSIVYMGIRAVDYVNRCLMFVKLGTYCLVVMLLMPFVSPEYWLQGDISGITLPTAIMVTITSFGFAIIIPSLRVYFASDVKKLRKAILIGSLIPLLCYIAWDMAIMGIIPLHGDNGLIAMLHSERSTSELVNTLSSQVQHHTITIFTRLFTSVCVVTSFLGVSLALSDFWADGLQLEKKGVNNLLIYAFTFLPPLVIVLLRPSVFIAALEYAGIYCVLLLILLPALMVWRGRYQIQLAKGYQVAGGRVLLAVLILFAILVIAESVKGWV